MKFLASDDGMALQSAYQFIDLLQDKITALLN
jgi:hypothetical protein